MDKLTGQIAAFANGLRYDHLGDDIAHAATQRLIDALGCALGAHDCGPAEIGRQLARNHPAVSNAVHKVEREILERAPLRYQVEELVQRLDGAR